jgi:hypothetical protein
VVFQPARFPATHNLREGQLVLFARLFSFSITLFFFREASQTPLHRSSEFIELERNTEVFYILASFFQVGWRESALVGDESAQDRLPLDSTTERDMGA